MKNIDEGDWSVGFNSVAPDRFSQAKLLSHLGGCLREVYGAVSAEPIPEQFVVFVESLEGRDLAEASEGCS
jgi:hypothetical protein